MARRSEKKKSEERVKSKLARLQKRNSVSDSDKKPPRTHKSHFPVMRTPTPRISGTKCKKKGHLKYVIAESDKKKIIGCQRPGCDLYKVVEKL